MPLRWRSRGACYLPWWLCSVPLSCAGSIGAWVRSLSCSGRGYRCFHSSVTPLLHGLRRPSKESKKKRIRIRGVVEESLLATARSSGHFSLEYMGISLAFRKRNSILTKVEMKAGFLGAVMERFRGTGVLLILMAVLLFSGWLSLSFGLAPGAVVSLQLLAMTLSSSLVAYVRRIFSGTRTRPERTWRRILERFCGIGAGSPTRADAVMLPHPATLRSCSPSEVPESRSGSPRWPGSICGSARNASVALVGESGSGKSSPLWLLLPVYRSGPAEPSPSTGSDLKRTSLRRRVRFAQRIGIVLRD